MKKWEEIILLCEPTSEEKANALKGLEEIALELQERNISYIIFTYNDITYKLRYCHYKKEAFLEEKIATEETLYREYDVVTNPAQIVSVYKYLIQEV